MPDIELHQRKDRLNIQAAAYLSAKHDLSQQAIAQILRVSPSMVSRYLNDAKEYGLVKTTAVFLRKNAVDADEIERMYDFAKLGSDIRRLLPSPKCGKEPLLREVRVFSSGDTNEDWSHRLDTFGLSAAKELHSIVSPPSVKVIGVAWGETVARLIAGLGKINYSIRSRPALFIPTCGEPIAGMRIKDIGLSSSWLASELDRWLNGGKGHCLSMSGVPSFIPYAESTDDIPEKVKSVIEHHFGKKKLDASFINDLANAFFEDHVKTRSEEYQQTQIKINELDAVITSVGFPDQGQRTYTKDLAGRGISPAKLKQYVLFDIGGISIPVNSEAVPKVAEWNDRWTGVKLAHYEQCALRAVKHHKPGIIIVAIGKNKAEFVREAIVRGLCNCALIDFELAKELISRARPHDASE